MFKRERRARIEETSAGASDGRARPRRASRPNLESLDSRQLLATATSSALVASTTSAILGRGVTLTAQVSTVPPNSGTPTGLVNFFDGTVKLGSAPLPASGVTSFTTSALTLGTHAITASYAGDANDTPSTSTPYQVYVGDLPKSDFDGDGKTDVPVFGKDSTSGKYRFLVRTSSSGFTGSLTFDNNGNGFGNAQSIPVAADYFGDGRSAYALWTPNAQGGMTFVAISSASSQKVVSISFGGPGDVPVVADVDGDGRADFGVYGFQQGLGYRFYFLLSSGDFSYSHLQLFNNGGFGYGNAQAIPVVADFDGSGKAGFGVYIPSAAGSTFYYVSPTSGGSLSKTIGGPGDIPTAVDSDGDGKADLALYGPDPAKAGHYRFSVLTSGTGYDPARPTFFDNGGFGYGNGSSTPVMADYEGTGRADFGVYIPSTRGMQFVYQTGQTGAGVVLDFATSTDLALTAPTYLIAKKVRGQ